MDQKRRDRHEKHDQESQFDFDDAKNLTVGQVIRKNEEVEAGVLPEDSILDKYIKQHREEIEADKFETRQFKKEELAATQSLEELIQAVRETSDTTADEELGEKASTDATDTNSSDFVLPPLEEKSQKIEPLVVTKKGADEDDEVQEDDTVLLSRATAIEPETEADSIKKRVMIIASVLIVIVILLGSYFVYRQISRSNQEIQSSQSASTDQATQTALQEFNTLYDAFYTDSNKTALKNSQFDKLSQLKTLLDKLEGSREYTLAKSKYDSLETQIKAIQDVNAQFEKPAIVDGVLDTNAKAKSDAKFTDIKTGNTELDKVLDKAISLGKSQQTSASSSSQASSSNSSQASSNTTSETSSSSSNATSNETRSSRGEVNMGVSSAGVAVQRSASRVSYNQSAIDDSNNSAWDFADGVLEQILATSRSRGYITGNQYILERVNIVNGNGYYNLYKPDGTYLFTLNCKTGYFVGNGSGHADALDY